MNARTHVPPTDEAAPSSSASHHSPAAVPAERRDDSSAPPPPGLRQFAVAAGLIVGVGGVFVGALILAVQVGGWQPDAGTLTMVLLSGLTLPSAAVVLLVVRRSTVLSARIVGFRRPSWRFLHLLWQIPVFYVVAIAVSGVVLTTLFDGGGDAGGVSSTAAELQEAGGDGFAVLVLWLLVAVVTPLWEEVLFRGILFQALGAKMPWFLAALIGAAVFAAIHIAPQALAYVFVLGLACCMLFRFHGNLWAPIALHVVNNSVIVLVAAAAVRS